MLLLLFKNFWWAALWPYCTMQLAMEKAARQAADGFKPPPPQPPQGPQPSPPNQEPVRQQESIMASDAFKPQTEPLRELMKMSIEQAKRAFETFISTSEKTWKSLENSSPSGRASLYALNAKIAEITRRNAEATFALAMKLAENKDIHQAMELQSQHVRTQMETFVHQLEEMRDLTAQLIQEANPATRTDMSSARPTPGSTRPAPGLSPVSSSPYAPSSSYPPGETGRTY